MKFIPLVRVNNFLPFVAFLDRLGSPADRWLEEVNLSPFALDNPENLIPRHLTFAFAEKAARFEGIENLGLLIGRKSTIADLGNFGRLICGSFTLYDALMTLQQLAPANNSGELWWLKEEKGQENGGQSDRIWFCMEHTGGIWSPYGSQFALTQIIDLIGLAAGKDWRPIDICLQTRQSPVVSESFDGIPLRMGVGFTGVCFPRSLLRLPLRSPIKLTDGQIQQDQASLQASAPATDLSGSLQQALVSLLCGGYPDVHLATEITGLSLRTLQRRLGEEGFTYSRLVEKTRFEQAVIWLQDPRVKLVDITLELGYSDPAHFTRAFKRWTGLSPREYRQQKLTISSTKFSSLV
jgi:AraC-like DNA-binding protein